MKRSEKHKSVAMGAIRIISGRWRGRKLPVMDLDGLRPTTDRTKETLFNWLLGDTQNAQCLDMFAGSGGLGFECLSRHAQSVTFIEQNAAAAKLLRENCTRLGVTSEQADVREGNALQMVKNLPHPFQLIFIDPPFNKQLVNASLDALVNSDAVAPDCLIYIEQESSAGSPQVPQHWQRIKHKKTAQVEYALYCAGATE